VFLSFCRKFSGDTRGVTALLFGLMLIPLILAVGAGVDMARAAQIRAMLQSTVDASALAGAAAYTSPSAQGKATSLTQNYVTKGTGALPSSVTVTSTTITPGTTGSGNNTAYTMHVNVTISVPTTLMYLWKPAMTVTASATAMNPVVTVTISGNGFKSSACDANTVYWYIVPSNGGVPSASAINYIWSNGDSSQPSLSVSLAASQQIGFAMKNVTGGQCGYGNNQYGAKQGDAQWFYSSLSNPNSQAGIAPGGSATGTHGNYPSTKDCSLQVVKGTYSNSSHSWSYPNPNNMCFTSTSSPSMTTATINAAPTCAGLSGSSYQYQWNDMGGNPDDVDYNDLVFNMQCSGGSGSGNGTNTTGVVLTN
jgi:Flp pilus assembly protein TadG